MNSDRSTAGLLAWTGLAALTAGRDALATATRLIFPNLNTKQARHCLPHTIFKRESVEQRD